MEKAQRISSNFLLGQLLLTQARNGSKTGFGGDVTRLTPSVIRLIAYIRYRRIILERMSMSAYIDEFDKPSV
jgi:hypothetical protein